MATFPGEPGRVGLIGAMGERGAKDDEGGGDYRSYKTCKAPVKSSLATNQHPIFYGALPGVQPTVSKH